MRAFIRVLAASLLLVVVMAGVASSPSEAQSSGITRGDGLAQVSGQIRFADGTRADGGRVNLFTENRAEFVANDNLNRTNFYGFGGIEPGCYVLTAIAPDGEVFEASGTKFLNIPFCVEANEGIFGLHAELAVQGGGRTIATGTVNFIPDSPAGDVVLNLFTERRAEFLRSNVVSEDSNGDFSIILPRAGCYLSLIHI